MSPGTNIPRPGSRGASPQPGLRNAFKPGDHFSGGRVRLPLCACFLTGEWCSFEVTEADAAGRDRLRRQRNDLIDATLRRLSLER